MPRHVWFVLQKALLWEGNLPQPDQLRCVELASNTYSGKFSAVSVVPLRITGQEEPCLVQLLAPRPLDVLLTHRATD